MKTTASLIAALASVAAFQAGQAATINLTGTVRDFHYAGTSGGHPDFEAFLGDDRGVVKSVLGVDGKPVYNGSPTTPTTTGAANFNQWYRDTPGINASAPVSITLDETFPGSGIYRYDNQAFFPIDGQLLGDQGSGHNYAFTYELPTTFTYEPGQTFNFRGDDDVWVFINDQLVIDLGGVHGAESAGVNLDTLGLTPGNTYDLNLFFAERHTVGSSFLMETSIQLTGVPEPSSIATSALLCLGVAGCWWRRRQSR